VPSCFKLKDHLIPFLIFALFPTVFGKIFEIFGHIDFSIYDALYVMTAVCATFINACFFIVHYPEYRTAVKGKKELNPLIDKLNLELEKEKEKLHQLKEERTMQAKQTHDLSSEPIHTQVVNLIPYPAQEKGHQLVKKYNKN